MKSMDRIRGAMYGVAVGDALGAPLEFMSAECIQARHGVVRDMIGGGWLKVRPGEITDDTQMTLCVARGIVEDPISPVEPVGMQFLQWYASGPKDVGAICSSAISNVAGAWRAFKIPTESDWREASLRSHILHNERSAGNGSLMRTVYVGLYYNNDLSIIDKAQRISQMTHYDPVAAAACSSYSLLLSRLVREDDISRRRIFMEYGISLCDPDVLAADDFIPKPTGYVVDSYAAALHCLYTTSSFEEAVVKAVNLGGDADTIGAITGGLAGALYGFDAIPQRWTMQLDQAVRDEIDTLAEKAKNA